MIEKAFAWADANGAKRTNAVHGEEEIKIVLDQTFEVAKSQTESTERSGNFTVEARKICRSSVYRNFSL